MPNSALLGGLLSGYASTREQSLQRDFEREQAERAQRIAILQAAATNPNLDPNSLPAIWQGMQDVFGGGKGGKKSKGGGAQSAPAAALPTPPATLSGGVAPLPATGAPGNPGVPQDPASVGNVMAGVPPSVTPPPPQSPIQRVESGMQKAAGVIGQGARAIVPRGTRDAGGPPLPPISFLSPEEQAARAQSIAASTSQAQATFRTQQADAVGLTGTARQAYILEGRLPAQFGSNVIHPVGTTTASYAQQAYPGAVNLDGSQFDFSKLDGNTPLKVDQVGDNIVLTPVAPPQASPNTALAQLTDAFRTLASADPNSPEARAAADLVAKNDPSRVRTTESERVITITNPDGSTQAVKIPIQSTSTTSPRAGLNQPEPPASLTSGTGAAEPIPGAGGHKVLPQAAERQISGAVTLREFAQMVRDALMQTGANPNDNGLISKLKDSAQNLLYRAGFDVPLAPVANLSGLMQAMAAATIGTGRMNSTLLDIAQQHVPGANQTPRAIATRAMLVAKAADTVREQIAKQYGVDVDENGHPTVPGGKPAKPPGGGSSTPTTADQFFSKHGGG